MVASGSIAELTGQGRGRARRGRRRRRGARRAPRAPKGSRSSSRAQRLDRARTGPDLPVGRGPRPGPRRRRRGRRRASAASATARSPSRTCSSRSARDGRRPHAARLRRPGSSGAGSDDRRQPAILDRGYRRYDGRRTGTSGAVRALVVHSMQRALGLKRPAGQKILPVLAVFIAYVPAIVFVGLSVLIQDTLLANRNMRPDLRRLLLVHLGRHRGVQRLRRARAALHRPAHRDARPLPGLAAHPEQLPGGQGDGRGDDRSRSSPSGPPLLMLVAFTLIGKGPDGPARAGPACSVEILLGGMAVAACSTRRCPWPCRAPPPGRPPPRPGSSSSCSASTAVSDALSHGADAAPELFCLNLLQLPFELVQPDLRRALHRSDHRRRRHAHPGRGLPGVDVRCSPAFTWLRYRTDAGRPMTATIEVDHASKWFGDLVAVSDVSFQVGPGVTALLGPNGAGKSTHAADAVRAHPAVAGHGPRPRRRPPPRPRPHPPHRAGAPAGGAVREPVRLRVRAPRRRAHQGRRPRLPPRRSRPRPRRARPRRPPARAAPTPRACASG